MPGGAKRYGGGVGPYGGDFATILLNGLRDYGVSGQLGLEKTLEEYLAKMVDVFREVKRVLRKDGTCWVNMGDSYSSQGGPQVVNTINSNRIGGSDSQNSGQSRKANNGLKPKDLMGVPWRVAFALRDDGWWLRQDIIWSKPNPMPESVTDRCTKSHEYLFLLSKSANYYYDAEAIKEPNSDGRNRRSVWTIATESFPDAHFATFSRKLVEPCIKAGCPVGGTVLDPFSGSGTTGIVAYDLGREFIGIELSPEYCRMAEKRLALQQAQMRLF